MHAVGVYLIEVDALIACAPGCNASTLVRAVPDVDPIDGQRLEILVQLDQDPVGIFPKRGNLGFGLRLDVGHVDQEQGVMGR